MSAVAWPAGDECMLGDRILHARFLAAVRLLACLMRAMPQAVAESRLVQEIEQPQRSVRALLHRLHQSGLIAQDGAARDTWRCAQDPGAVTFADVFQCISVSQADAPASGLADDGSGTGASPARQTVDLLLMQATMTVNRVVLQQLQQFDLGRLMLVAPPNAFRASNPYSLPGLAEPG